MVRSAPTLLMQMHFTMEGHGERRGCCGGMVVSEDGLVGTGTGGVVVVQVMVKVNGVGAGRTDSGGRRQTAADGVRTVFSAWKYGCAVRRGQ